MASGGAAAAVDDGCDQWLWWQWQVRPAAAVPAADDNCQGYDPTKMASPPGKCGRRRRRQLPMLTVGADDGDGAGGGSDEPVRKELGGADDD